MYITYLYQLRVGNTVSKDISGYKLQNFPVGMRRLPQNPLAMYKTKRTCQQPRSRFAWILSIRIIIFPIIDQCRNFLSL